MSLHHITQQSLVNTYANRGITIESGDGVYLIDTDGKKYLDMMSNYGVNLFGYNYPQITKAFHEQIEKLTNLHSSFNNQVRTNASLQLLKRLPENMDKLFWSNSGAEAIEAAMKFAVIATKKNKFLVLKNGYHGKTIGALSLTTSFHQKYQTPFVNILIENMSIPLNDIQALDTISETYAAVVIELIQGEGGIYPINKNFLTTLKERCNNNGVLLIVDEIQTGLGRTGTFLCLEQYGIHADMICLAKGIAGGIPCGVTAVTQEIAQLIPKGIHTNTNGGNPLSMAGVLATLALLSDEQLKLIHQNATYFMNELKHIHSSKIKEIRGIGYMIGIEFTEAAIPFIKALQKEGILVIPAGENVIRLLPPLTISKENINTFIKTLSKILIS